MISRNTEKISLFRILTIICFIVVFPFSSSGSEPGSTQVEVEGYASIVGGRKDQAREAAIQNAFRRAVEQVVGVAVESRTVIKDSELLNDRIFSKSRGLIKTYRIISENTEKDAYRVTVLAAVSRYRLEQELDNAGVLIRKIGRPRTAIVVVEQNTEGVSAPGGVIESYLVGSFARKGYNLVDRQAMVAIEKIAAASGDHTDAVVRAAAAGGAEVVILGQAKATQGNPVPGMSMRPVQVAASCRVLDADTAEVLATVSLTRQALNVNPSAAGTEALQAAAGEISDSLDRQLVLVWNKRLSGLRTVRMTISGVQFSNTAKIIDDLKERLDIVEDVQERGFKGGQLRLDLQIAGSVRALVDGIAVIDFAGVRLTVTGFSGGQVHARWSGKQQQKRGKR